MYDKIQLSQLQLEKIEKHTLAEYPKEMCGFLTADDFFPAENIAERREGDPEDRDARELRFTINPLDYAKYYSKAIAIVHSHCRKAKQPEVFDLRTPSYRDMIEQPRTNLPWLIVGCEGINVSTPLQFPRIPNNNYLNRHFLWFINDCYTLVQDWYLFELDITLKPYVLSGDYTAIRCLSNLFETHIEDYGFKEVPYAEIQKHDLVILDNGAFESNHLGIFTGTSILHQDSLSVEVPFETFIGRIKKVVRYVE